LGGVWRRTIAIFALLASTGAHAAEGIALRLGPVLTLGNMRSGARGELAGARTVVLHALGFLGVPYVYGGASPATGFDCSGLVRYVVEQALGVLLPRQARAMARVRAPVARDELRPGDLVFFNTLRRPYSHVGIYIGDRRFIHAPTAGRVVELADMRARYWQHRFEGARRLEL
jgi:cell wall-associated NlpC family hydrolase